jgi:hypothetical protein
VANDVLLSKIWRSSWRAIGSQPIDVLLSVIFSICPYLALSKCSIPKAVFMQGTFIFIAQLKRGFT